MAAVLIVSVLVYVALLHVVTRRVLIERFEMSVQDQINVLVEQLRKANAEIVARLAEAEANISSQLVDAGAQDAVDLSELTAIAQDLDDIVPDAVVVEPEVPVEEVPVEEVPTVPGELEESVEVPVGESVAGVDGAFGVPRRRSE
jgi:hypothetical protein